jgi:hypothetical protein
MAINMSTFVYLPCQEVLGRPVNFSSTLGNSFSGAGRGIYDSRSLNVMLEDGSIMSDQDTILDIRAIEFSSLPVQGDLIDIPAEPIAGLPALGMFEIADVSNKVGGEITLSLKRKV